MPRSVARWPTGWSRLAMVAGWRPFDLARASGFGGISKHEQGQNSIGIAAAIKLSRALGVDPRWIMFPGESYDTIDVPGPLAEVVKHLRVRSGFPNIHQLAMASGISGATLGDIENFGMIPRQPSFVTLAPHLGVSAPSLMFVDYQREIAKAELVDWHADADDGVVWFRGPGGFRVQSLVVGGVRITGTLDGDDQVTWRVGGAPFAVLTTHTEDFVAASLNYSALLRPRLGD